MGVHSRRAAPTAGLRTALSCDRMPVSCLELGDVWRNIAKDLGDEYALLSYGDLMTDEDWVKKLLMLCEQKYGPDAPAMRQLRRQLQAIRQPEPKAMQQFVTGRGMQRTR